MGAVGYVAIPPVGKLRLVVTTACSVVLIGTAWTSAQLGLRHGWDAALGSGLAWGVCQTAIQTGVGLHQRKERLSLAPRHLTIEQRRAAIRASLAGPVPDDPEVRLEAVRLCRARTAVLEPGTRAYLVFCSAVLVAALVGGALTSRWWWCTAACFAVAGAYVAVTSRRSARQAGRLERAVRADQAEVSGRAPSASP